MTRHFGSNPAALATLAHLSISLLQMRAELFGRAADQAEAELCRALLHVGVGEDFVGVGVDLGDTAGGVPAGANSAYQLVSLP